MDAVTGLLSGPRARGAFLVRSILTAPWSIRIRDEAPLTIIAILQGGGWLLPDRGEPVELRPGGVAIVRGPEHYTVADDPSTPPRVIIHPGQFSTTMDGDELCEAMTLGPRTWGDTASGSVTMLTGTYQSPSEVSRLLLAALPPVIVVTQDGWDGRFLSLLSDEMRTEDPGQEVVLDRLLDLVLVDALRAWSARPDENAPGGHPFRDDAIVSAALRLIHDDPARPWTVASLATGVGVSRAALARRFTAVMGTPPMAYLTQWRLALAADLLREPAATIASVARQVGYSNAFALSTAFKRIRGVSPRDHRLTTAG
jgi:AraC-like DNA-binding protein